MKDTTKTKHMIGLMDKAIAKANQNEFDRYGKLFNTYQMAVQTHVTDQEAILVRYVHPDILVSSSVFVRIKYIKQDK
jgi:formaldehyde-activating enzyme involved in methanogenesis